MLIRGQGIKDLFAINRTSCSPLVMDQYISGVPVILEQNTQKNSTIVGQYRL